MATDVVVVVPFAGGCEWREAALAEVLAWWEQFPWPTVVGALPAGVPWVKAAAVTEGLDGCGDPDVVVIADADVFLSTPGDVSEAVARVTAGVCSWAVPHHRVKRLTQQATVEWQASRVLPTRGPWARPPYRGQRAGGIVAVAGDLYRQVPLDARFVGWGHEDVAADVAWTTVGGEPWRGRSDLFHLWHPPARKITEAVGSRESKLLLNQYRAAAKGGADAVRALAAAGR